VIALNGGLPHQTASPSYKDFGWMVFLGVEPRSVRVVLAEGHRRAEDTFSTFICDEQTGGTINILFVQKARLYLIAGTKERVEPLLTKCGIVGFVA
jgi:hypothetical protein